MPITTEVNVRTGDVGTVLAFTIKDETGGVIDLTDAIEAVLRIEKPDGEIEEVDLELGDGAEDGEASYTIDSDDLDQTGTYRLQTWVTTSAGTWHSTIDKLRVHRNLPAPD